MITITLTGESLSAIKQQMTEFLVDTQQLHAVVTAPKGWPLPPHEAPVEVAAPEEVKPFELEVQKKRTRRTKAEIEAEKTARTGGNGVFNPPPEPTTVQAVATPTQVAPVNGTASKQHVHEALQQVNVAVGLPKSREILTSFGANRISEIKEDQFKAFVDKCNEVVMLHG